MASYDRGEDGAEKDGSRGASKWRDTTLCVAVISGAFVVVAALIQAGPVYFALFSPQKPAGTGTDAKPTTTPTAEAPFKVTPSAASTAAHDSTRSPGAENGTLYIASGALDPHYVSSLLLGLAGKGYRVTADAQDAAVRLEISAAAPVIARYTVGTTAMTRATIAASLKAVDSKTHAVLIDVMCRAIGAGFDVDEATANAIDDAARQMAASYLSMIEK